MSLKLVRALWWCSLLLISGCTALINATTSEPIYVDLGKRTLGARIDDSKIETVAAVNINKANPAFAETNVQVTSFNAVVLLTGQVTNDTLRDLAAETVKKIPQVRQVHNELLSTANITLGQKSYDTWLTTKVKSKLLAFGDIEGRRVKVVSENKTVFLMGLATRKEADNITDVARNTSGVKQVVRVFEYID